MSYMHDCAICGQGAMTSPDLKTHMLLDHEENGGSCPLCDLQHLTLDELSQHVNTAHSRLLSVKPTCTTKYADKDTRIMLKGKDAHMQYLGCKDKICDIPQTESNSTLNLTSSNFQVCDVTKVSTAIGTVPNSDGCTDDGSEPSWQFQSNGCLKENHLGRPSSTSDGIVDVSSDTSIDRRRLLSFLDRKRRRSTAQMSSQSSTSSVDDVTVALKDQMKGSSTSASSPFKKLLRLITPRKRGSIKSERDAEAATWSASSSSRCGSEDILDITTKGIWSNNMRHDNDIVGDDDDDDVIIIADDVSKPECPFCNVTDLDSKSIMKHVTQEHSDLLNSPVPRRNTSAIQTCEKSPTKSPKKTLLDLSKQSCYLATVATCPLCGLGSYDPDFLTVHINTEHPSPEGVKITTTPPQHTLDNSECPVCGVTGIAPSLLNDHVEGHFEVKGQELHDQELACQLAEDEKQLADRRQKETFKQLQAQYGMDDTSSYQKQSEQDLQKAVVRGQITVSEYNRTRSCLQESVAIGVDDGKSRTSGLIEKICSYYTQQTVQGLRCARLCGNMDHYASSYGDTGWGCGYRNLQMLLSSLVRIDEYRPVIFSGQDAIPSIYKLQQLIEAAWSKGFDPQGKQQLGGRLINSRKWIGATEIVAMLSSLQARCRLIDFHSPTGPGGTHPALFEWVREYFGRSEGAGLRLKLRSVGVGARGMKIESVHSKRTPLYLQHQGHSRTIIGCEVHNDNSIRLLLLDPSHRVSDHQGLGLATLDGYAMRPIRKSLSQMKAKQYQIVSVDRLMMSEQEYEQSKTIRSERKP